MSIIKKTALAAVAFATLASAAPAQAAGLMTIAPIASAQNDAAVEVSNVGYRKYRVRRHFQRHYRPLRYKYVHRAKHCHWKKKKVWSNYHYHFIWKKVRFCHYSH